jgi:hypothetical protein
MGIKTNVAKVNYSYDELHTRYYKNNVDAYWDEYEDSNYVEPELDLGFDAEPEPTIEEINRLSSELERDPLEDEYFNEDYTDAYFDYR